MIKTDSIWIAAIARGHNSSVCLLKDGEVIFNIEEERLSRQKYDGGPFAGMYKILEYTDKIDYLVIAHTQPLAEASRIDFSGDDVYTGLARKLGLISRKENPFDHPQVIDMSSYHHKLHAACAFYRSGFDTAAGVVVDGAGTFINMGDNVVWEVETIFNCSYPNNIQTIRKNIGTTGPTVEKFATNIDGGIFNDNESHEAYVFEKAGITKTYEAVTEYCGWNFIEAGKTMGLFPYGKPNNNIPSLFHETAYGDVSNRNLIIPTYPNGAYINKDVYLELSDSGEEGQDLTLLQNRRDLAYAVQTQTQEQVLKLIHKAVEMTGQNKVVISGGYGLNCVANYYYLDNLDKDIEIYVEPVSNDSGTAMGAALLQWYKISRDTNVRERKETLYEGFSYQYSSDDINKIASKYNATVQSATNEDVIKLITDKNIVSIFQGKSENGPRALGNRSILYDPTDPNGKDFVNSVKHREYFRPFAGSILEEDVHEWFDLRGMESSPTMMYAVNCQPGVEEKIPAIIHVDGTCRIQTVNREQNKNYYDLIKAFKDATGCPIIFNTSFNLGGEPLVETLEDALWTLSKSKINYLYLPEYKTLITCTSE